MFVSGRELSRRFYQEQVHPVLHSGYPGLPYSAALLGRGSEVLGFDDEMSRDHSWEPRVLLFLRDADYARYGEAVDRSLRDGLPTRFAGYPTQFSLSTLRAYLHEHLDLDVDVVFTLFHAVETKPPPFGSIVNPRATAGMARILHRALGCTFPRRGCRN